MKKKWEAVDWVELGCRGWDVELDGADLGPQIESDWDYDYASLDRATLDIVMSGRPAFIARVVDDLRAAGLLASMVTHWIDSGDTLSSGTLTADTSSGVPTMLRLTG